MFINNFKCRFSHTFMANWQNNFRGKLCLILLFWLVGN